MDQIANKKENLDTIQITKNKANKLADEYRIFSKKEISDEFAKIEKLYRRLKGFNTELKKEKNIFDRQVVQRQVNEQIEKASKIRERIKGLRSKIVDQGKDLNTDDISKQISDFESISVLQREKRKLISQLLIVDTNIKFLRQLISKGDNIKFDFSNVDVGTILRNREENAVQESELIFDRKRISTQIKILQKKKIEIDFEKENLEKKKQKLILDNKNLLTQGNIEVQKEKENLESYIKEVNIINNSLRKKFNLAESHFLEKLSNLKSIASKNIGDVDRRISDLNKRISIFEGKVNVENKFYNEKKKVILKRIQENEKNEDQLESSKQSLLEMINSERNEYNDKLKKTTNELTELKFKISHMNTEHKSNNDDNVMSGLKNIKLENEITNLNSQVDRKREVVNILKLQLDELIQQEQDLEKRNWRIKSELNSREKLFNKELLELEDQNKQNTEDHESSIVNCKTHIISLGKEKEKIEFDLNEHKRKINNDISSAKNDFNYHTENNNEKITEVKNEIELKNNRYETKIKAGEMELSKVNKKIEDKVYEIKLIDSELSDYYFALSYNNSETEMVDLKIKEIESKINILGKNETESGLQFNVGSIDIDSLKKDIDEKKELLVTEFNGDIAHLFKIELNSDKFKTHSRKLIKWQAEVTELIDKYDDFYSTAQIHGRI